MRLFWLTFVWAMLISSVAIAADRIVIMGNMVPGSYTINGETVIVDENGVWLWVQSPTDTGSYSTTRTGTPGDLNDPEQVDGMTISSVTTSSMVVSWNEAGDDITIPAEMRYYVDETTGNSGTTYDGAVLTGTTTFTATDLPEDTIYAWRVRARDSAGNYGEWSDTVTDTTLTTAALDPPTSVTLTALSDDSLAVAWSGEDEAATHHMVRVTAATWAYDSLSTQDVTTAWTGYGTQQIINNGYGEWAYDGTPDTVTTTADSGVGSLRYLLQTAPVDSAYIWFDPTVFASDDTIRVESVIDVYASRFVLDATNVTGRVTIMLDEAVREECDYFAANGSWPDGTAETCGVMKFLGQHYVGGELEDTVPGKRFRAVIRGVEILQGSTDVTNNDTQRSDADGLLIGSSASDIVVSNCTFGAAGDECLALGSGVQWITIQNCLFRDNVKGVLLGNHNTDHYRISMHRNVFANIGERSPYVGGDWHPDEGYGALEFYNNIIYGWWNRGMTIFDDLGANLIGNVWVPGDSTDNYLSSVGSYSEAIRVYGGTTQGELPLTKTGVYWLDNILPNEEVGTTQWVTDLDPGFQEDWSGAKRPLDYTLLGDVVGGVYTPNPDVHTPILAATAAPDTALSHAGCKRSTADSTLIATIFARYNTVGPTSGFGAAGIETYDSPVHRWVTASADTLVGLDPNTSYTVEVIACTDCDVADHLVSTSTTADTTFTLAVVPTITVDGPGTDRVDFNIDDATNPGYTLMQVYETTTAQYLQTDETLGAPAIWRFQAQWDVVDQVVGLTPATTYTFRAKARNEDGVETAWTPDASETTLTVGGGQWYISPDGDDSENDGLSTSRPWKTWAKALGATGIGSGDTLNVMDGTYTDIDAILNPNDATAGPSRAHRTLIRAVNPGSFNVRGSAIIDLEDDASGFLSLFGDDNMEIRGLDIVNGTYSITDAVVECVNGATGNKIVNCRYYRTDGYALGTTNESVATFFDANNGDGSEANACNANVIDSCWAEGLAHAGIDIAASDSCSVTNSYFSRGSVLSSPPDAQGRDAIRVASYASTRTSAYNTVRNVTLEWFRHGIAPLSGQNNLFEDVTFRNLRDDCFFESNNTGAPATMQAKRNVFRYMNCEGNPSADNFFELRGDSSVVEYSTFRNAPGNGFGFGTTSYSTVADTVRYNIFANIGGDRMVTYNSADSVMAIVYECNVYYDNDASIEFYDGTAYDFEGWQGIGNDTDSWFVNPYLQGMRPRCGAPFIGGCTGDLTPGLPLNPWCEQGGKGHRGRRDRGR